MIVTRCLSFYPMALTDNRLVGALAMHWKQFETLG
jgi:hypothetical protein